MKVKIFLHLLIMGGFIFFISCQRESKPAVFSQGDVLAVEYVKTDFSELKVDGSFWKKSKPKIISLTAQPIAVPRPKKTMTETLQVQAVHNGEWIAFRLQWQDKGKDEGGILGKFSDAVAIQFPVKKSEVPPPIFMGVQDNPVHILHWRAQYQKDKEEGMLTMKELYPNMAIDMYPLEFADEYVHDKILTRISQTQREIFVPGKAAGNPQSFRKLRGIDEIFAEGFGSSSVIENARAVARGVWGKNQWQVMIARPLNLQGGSELEIGKKGFAAFAVWQGGEGEVGSRKSVTMSWIPLEVKQWN